MSVILCMWALPWLPALGDGGIFMLFVWVIVTPLTRHTMYAPLLHIAVVFSLTSRLRGRESVFYVFHIAACIVYAHSAHRVRSADSSHQRHTTRTPFALSVCSLAVAVFSSSEAAVRECKSHGVDDADLQSSTNVSSRCPPVSHVDVFQVFR